MTTPCYYLNVSILGYDAEVFVNGAPVLASSRTHACYALPPVSEWIVQGENALSVRVYGGPLIDPHLAEAERRAQAASGEEPEEGDRSGAPPPADAGADDDDEPPQLRVALCRGVIGELVDPGQEDELLVVEWEPPPVPPEDEPLLDLPHDERDTVDVAHPWGTWAWEAAPAFDFAAEPGAVVDVADFLRGLLDALAQGQLQTLIDASPLKFDEVAPCYDFDPADARARLAQAWPEITKPAGWQLAPFDDADLELRECCEGRVLEPRTLAGEPILRQAEVIDDQRWTMPLFVARIDGQLQIVR